MELQRLIELIREENAKKSSLEKDCREISDAIAEREGASEAMKTVLAICQETASSIQMGLHKCVSGIVDRCLKAIFDNPYDFDIIFEEKRGRTEARPVFKRNGVEISNVMDACGGGVVDVVSFALRIAFIILAKPKKRRILLLDEPFRFVSSAYRGRIGELLECLSKDYGMQIVMVTHIGELKTGDILER